MPNRKLIKRILVFLLVFGCTAAISAQSSTTGRSRTRTVAYTLTINSNVKGGMVYLNDELQKETTPMAITDVAAGDYTVVVKAKGYFDFTQKVSVKADTVVMAELAPALTMTIDSNVKGAVVYLNGSRQKGAAPLSLANLKAGRYAVRVTAEGYFDYEASVNLQKSTTVTAKLSPALSMTINSNVKGADVFINGSRQKNTAPLNLGNLKAGKYTVLVSAEGYFDYEATVNLQKNATITAKLSPKLSLTVNSNVKGAYVSFNGTTIGESTPVLINNLKPGKYGIEVKASGYLPYTVTVDLQKNTVVNAVMKPALATVAVTFPKDVLNYAMLPKGIKDPMSQIVFLVDDERIELVKNRFTLPAGEHKVTIVSGGFVLSKTFTFTAGKQYTATPTMLLNFK